jgi:hypothetical protein
MKKILVIISAFFLIAAAGSCKKNACKSISCNNAGSCDNGQCQCDSLHEGAHCETDRRAKYFGSFVGKINCTSQTHIDYVKITAVTDTINTLTLHNLFGEEQNIRGILLADGSISIPLQYSNSNFLSGKASIIGNKLVVNFTVNSGGVADTCTWMQQW